MPILHGRIFSRLGCIAGVLLADCFLLIFLLTGSATAANFTLEQMMGSPFPSNLVAAGHSPRVAWVSDAKGVRNIWVADAPDFAARQLTHYDGDDGLPIAEKLAFDSSPDAAVSTWKSPVLLIHGDDDRNVPFGQTVDLAQRLREQHVRYEELIFPDEIHDFLMWKSWIRAYKATLDFFDRTLKTASPGK